MYHLGCHTWLSRDVLGFSTKGTKSFFINLKKVFSTVIQFIVEFTHKKIYGVFGHGSDVRNGNTLIVVGGYRGNINSDLLAFVLPPTLVSTRNDSYHLELMCLR